MGTDEIYKHHLFFGVHENSRSWTRAYINLKKFPLNA